MSGTIQLLSEMGKFNLIKYRYIKKIFKSKKYDLRERLVRHSKIDNQKRMHQTHSLVVYQGLNLRQGIFTIRNLSFNSFVLKALTI